MNIVLVCLNNYQDYITVNIEQLIKLNHSNIYVITHPNLFSNFDIFESKINLINADSLHESYEFENKTSLDKSFRGGFWYLTSLRFFYIYEFMKRYEIEDVIHLENDVLIYYNADELIDKVNKGFLYIPFDSYDRNIASIMYIPNKDIYKVILDNYDFNKNDMENFSIIKQKTGLIQNFPIFIANNNSNAEQQFVSTNSELFPFIFDAAAIGQYLGGIDPKNQSGDTKGFVNETCIIKYNNYRIWFEELISASTCFLNSDNNKICKKPFIEIEGNKVPIFNLHIHSKNLIGFV